MARFLLHIWDGEKIRYVDWKAKEPANLATSPSGGLNGVPSVRSGTGRCFKPSPVKTKGVEFKFLQAHILLLLENLQNKSGGIRTNEDYTLGINTSK